MSKFHGHTGFCPDCGAILPQLELTGGVTCKVCKYEIVAEAFKEMTSHYVIHFNSQDVYSLPERHKTDEGELAEGPLVERKCPKCGHDQMSYATLQLRSADEGQTVFYTCQKCKFKETENS